MATKRKKKKQQDALRGFLAFAAAILIIALAIVLCSIVDRAMSKPASADASSLVSGESSQEPVSSVQSESSKVYSGTSSSSSQNPASGEWDDTITIGSTHTDWNLRLVNTKHTLTAEDEPEIVDIVSNGTTYKIDKRILAPYTAMIAAAKEDGIKLTICSGFRFYSTQQRLYDKKVKQYLDKGKTQEEAEIIAATIVARPGTSEHQTGLAIDFNPCSAAFDNSKEYQWLSKNAAKFGFVQRYRSEKSEITGIINESWHFRFVGVEHAAYMNEHNLCLEEYIDYLNAQ